MKTLADAVADLNNHPNPREILDLYPNKRYLTTIPWRCSSCPTALHIGEQVGQRVWISSDGDVRLLGVGMETPHYAPEDEHYMLNGGLRQLVHEYDVTAR